MKHHNIFRWGACLMAAVLVFAISALPVHADTDLVALDRIHYQAQR
ncbi:MAG: hypothetical protein ACOX1H_07555 [Pseudoramibacter sp.]